MGHWASGFLSLGEGNNVTNGVGTAQKHNKSIETKGDAAMGWRPVLESVEHEAEPLLGLIIIDAQSLEYLQLQIIIVNTDTATADLIAV